MPEMPASGEAAAERAEPDGLPWGPQPAYMVAVDQLTAHPGNVREDLDLTPQFLASVAETGVRIPLLVTPHETGGYLVIEGHRRLAAAVRAGLPEVPCILDAGRADDQAGQFLDMVVANSDSHRRNFAPVEEAAALFAAHEAGASRTRIRKTTGRKAEDIKTALAVGKMSAETRAAAGDLAAQLTLDELALLAEFDGDEVAVAMILEALRRGLTVEYVAERIRQDRAEAAHHEQLVAELEAAGITVTEGPPDGAAQLAGLVHDGEDLTPEAHAGCPGRGAYFHSWNLEHPVHYCAAPAEHGHTVRTFGPPPAAGNDAEGADPAAPSALPDGPAADAPPDPGRRLVIEGNKAWGAAAEVRRRWLPQLFARRAAPREVARFVAGQLLTMPEPLRLGLAAAPGSPLFTDVTGLHADQAADGCDTCPAVRLPLLMLAPIAAAYEAAMAGTEAARSTWRADRYSPCPRPDAGRYLAFLASIGYHLTVIEQAVADGVPYAGDIPPEPIPGDHHDHGDHGGDAADVNGICRADDDASGESEAAAEGGAGQDGADEASRDDNAAGGDCEHAAPEGGDGLDGAPFEAA
jgi:ParB family transcriptional regulator, chromosome partitioning protein